MLPPLGASLAGVLSCFVEKDQPWMRTGDGLGVRSCSFNSREWGPYRSKFLKECNRLGTSLKLSVVKCGNAKICKTLHDIYVYKPMLIACLENMHEKTHRQYSRCGYSFYGCISSILALADWRCSQICGESLQVGKQRSVGRPAIIWIETRLIPRSCPANSNDDPTLSKRLDSNPSFLRLSRRRKVSEAVLCPIDGPVFVRAVVLRRQMVNG